MIPEDLVNDENWHTSHKGKLPGRRAGMDVVILRDCSQGTLP